MKYGVRSQKEAILLQDVINPAGFKFQNIKETKETTNKP